MSDSLRFGLIGCGSQGRYLSEALRITGRASLLACADPNEEAARQAVAQCGYEQTFESADAMFAATDLDAVIVATIHDQLQPMAMEAVEAGVDVFVEKPMALSATDGQDLVDAARAAGRKLMVGYTLRFMPERLMMKQLLQQGAIGDITHVCTGQCIGPVGGWLNNPQHGGGPLFYIGSHALDNALWMTEANPYEVFADVYRPDPSEAEQSVDAVIRCEGDFSIHLCTSYRIGGRAGWLQIMGTGGTMRVEWESNVLEIYSESIEAYNQPTRVEVPLQPWLPQMPTESVGSIVAAKYLPMWAAEMHEFINAIEEDRDPCVTGEDAVAFLEVADAIFASGASGVAVPVAGK